VDADKAIEEAVKDLEQTQDEARGQAGSVIKKGLSHKQWTGTWSNIHLQSICQTQTANAVSTWT
jgi:hypothetical protein